MKKIKKVIVTILIALVLVINGGLFYAGNYLVNYAIGRSGDGGNRDVALEVDKEAKDSVQSERDKNGEVQKQRTALFLEEVNVQEVEINSQDGLLLKAGYFENSDSHLYCIAIHGYRGNRTNMNDYAERYYHQGYSVLAPDLRGCGNSEGDYIGMGWPDRFDILDWCNWIINQDSQAKIVLHGVSMGAATVMMTSGENTPENVVCFVEDCGYTSVWDIFASELGLRFHLPTFPILNVSSVIANMKADLNFTSASSIQQVKNCEKPMLFIHGNQDDFVPFEMLDVLYEAKPGDNKKKIVVENAGHGEAKKVYGEQYWQETFDFINEYVK